MVLLLHHEKPKSEAKIVVSTGDKQQWRRHEATTSECAVAQQMKCEMLKMTHRLIKLKTKHA
jgi:hypothetical protein